MVWSNFKLESEINALVKNEYPGNTSCQDLDSNLVLEINKYLDEFLYWKVRDTNYWICYIIWEFLKIRILWNLRNLVKSKDFS